MPFVPRTRAWLLGILAVAVLIRAAHLSAIASTAFPKFPLVFDQSDLSTYWEWAQGIRAGDWLGRDPYHPAFRWMMDIAPLETWYRWWGGKAIFQEAPLYAYGVAGLLAASAGSLLFVDAVQLAVGALQPLVMFWLGRRFYGDDRVGLVAAALTAVYGPFVFHQGALLRDWLPPLLEPLALVALLRAREKGRAAAWVAGGAAIGLALLAKETFLVFAPLALAWTAWELRREPRRAALAVAALAAGIALVLSPLVARNVAVGAPALAFSNRAAEGLIEGNAADGFPVGLTHPPSMKGILERSDGRLGRVAWEVARTYTGDAPAFARVLLLKLRALVDPLEVPNNLSVSYGREISPALRLSLTYGAIFPLGVAGFALALGACRRRGLFLLYALAVVTALVSTIVLARFRLALVPVLIVCAAAGLVWCWDAARTPRAGRVAAYAALVIGSAAAQHLAAPIPALRDMPDLAVYPPEYLLAAHIYAHDGQFDRALAQIARLQARAAERPAFADLARAAALSETELRTLWAGRLLAAGRRDLAIEQAAKAAAALPSPPGSASPLYDLGALFARLGEPGRARAHLQRFLAAEPAGPRADRARRALADLDR